MKKITSIIFSLILGIGFSFGQSADEKPKLIIGIVVDQMRQEYLYKYAERYSEGGFKRLMNEGFMMKNGHYNYIPTYTGPGHASVYTGTTPATHGIIGNNWYIKSLNKSIYCAGDSTVTNVGGTPSNGKISPRNMLTTTITDELRFATNKRSKVVGIAIKDRGASLPAGHLGDAYWYDSKNGEFMTSTYYHESLPQWAQEFNAKKIPDTYLTQTWNTHYPIETYKQSIADDNAFEGLFVGKETPTFPYSLQELKAKNDQYGLLAGTPFGNTLTFDFAYAAIEGEQLGKRGETDFLAVSFSSPDYIGHRFGPSSIEIEDTYLRLDLEMEQFLNFLDKTYGEGSYLIFLSADHGVADIATYMLSERVPAGNINSGFIASQMKTYVQQKYGEGNWILNFSNEQVFLNSALAQDKGINLVDLEDDIASFLLKFSGIKEVYTSTALRNNSFTQTRPALLQNGFNHKSSGELLLILEPGWLAGGAKGTSHGTGFTYDTHVPILFFGWKVKHGTSSRYASITDIAPTLSMMLNIRLPNGSDGTPIFEIIDK